MINLGLAVYKYRIKIGKKQYEFANDCGISKTYLSRIERNVKMPKMQILMTMCEQFDIGLHDLFLLAWELRL